LKSYSTNDLDIVMTIESFDEEPCWYLFLMIWWLLSMIWNLKLCGFVVKRL